MSLDARLDVRVDGTVEFALTVTNPTTEHVELTFSDGMIADVTVFDGDREVWRWGEGRVFTQALRSETLAPGESSVSTLIWEDPEPGRYRAVATLQARDVEARASTIFEV